MLISMAAAVGMTGTALGMAALRKVFWLVHRRRYAGKPRCMEHKTAGNGLIRLWWRLLDGERPWGAVDILPDRYGVTRYRLVVYPPGISGTDRRWVRLWRGWPMWGPALWIVVGIAMSEVTGRLSAIGVSTAAFLGCGAVTFVLAGDARTRVHKMFVMVMAGYDDPAARAICDKLQTLANMMAAADEQRCRELISAIDYEMVWWRVYDQMTPAAPPRPVCTGADRARSGRVSFSKNSAANRSCCTDMRKA